MKYSPYPAFSITRRAAASTSEHGTPGAARSIAAPWASSTIDQTLRYSSVGVPNHVERVKQLARQGFYDGVKFHRVIDGFMAQTGDPTATGQGGSSLPDLKAEFNDVPHMRGTVSMARAESPDSANSQFFIMFQPRFSLDHRYTAFGRVISGMQYVDAVQRGEPPAVMSRIVQMSVAADNKPMPPASALVEDKPAAAPEVTVDQLNAPIKQ